MIIFIYIYISHFNICCDDDDLSLLLGGGKFEESYKEILPLLPSLLNGLYRVYAVTDYPPLQQMIIELCLTVPARLSSLLPHLSLQLRIIIPAIQSEVDDLINLG